MARVSHCDNYWFAVCCVVSKMLAVTNSTRMFALLRIIFYCAARQNHLPNKELSGQAPAAADSANLTT